jgi:hypothetical protein
VGPRQEQAAPQRRDVFPLTWEGHGELKFERPEGYAGNYYLPRRASIVQKILIPSELSLYEWLLDEGRKAGQKTPDGQWYIVAPGSYPRIADRTGWSLSTVQRAMSEGLPDKECIQATGLHRVTHQRPRMRYKVRVNYGDVLAACREKFATDNGNPYRTPPGERSVWRLYGRLVSKEEGEKWRIAEVWEQYCAEHAPAIPAANVQTSHPAVTRPARPPSAEDKAVARLLYDQWRNGERGHSLEEAIGVYLDKHRGLAQRGAAAEFASTVFQSALELRHAEPGHPQAESYLKLGRERVPELLDEARESFESRGPPGGE